jgi:mannan polymerase II complex MNN10 subunit
VEDRGFRNISSDSLPVIPGTPADPNMSLSRSPSPQRGGGWSSPGLTTPYNGSSGRSTPMRSYANGSTASVTWASAQARSAEVKGYPSLSSHGQGNFLSRHFRKLSMTLPHLGYAEKEKLGRGRWRPNSNTKIGQAVAFLGRIIWRLRLRLAIVLGFVLCIILFYVTRKHLHPV